MTILMGCEGIWKKASPKSPNTSFYTSFLSSKITIRTIILALSLLAIGESFIIPRTSKFEEIFTTFAEHPDKYNKMSSNAAAISVNATLAATKKILRSKIRKSLKDLPPPTLTAESDAVEGHLANWDLYKGCSSVGIFLSMPKGEINTRGMVARAIRDGKEVYVPR
jgi:hypothetical protein